MAYLRGTMEQRISDNNQSKRDIPSFIEPKPPLISNPFMRPKPVKGTNLLELFDEDSEYEETDLLQVYLRMKPSNVQSNLYEIRSEQCLVTSIDTATAGHGRRTQHNVNKMYTFSRIFGPDTSQKEIFENVVKENLRRLADGHSYTLLTYGASGSGKTYTLMGTVSSPGLVPRSLEYVFKVVDAAQQPLYRPSDGGAERLSAADQEAELQWVKKLRHVSAPLRDKYRRMSVQLRDDMSESTLNLANRTRYYVWVSFVEIYNEAVYDLLVPGDRRTSSKLRIREDPSGMVFVKGATLAFVRSGLEAYDVMVAGKHNLQVAATGVHAHSSRSHCIFTITMVTQTEGGACRSSCVRLCDLAGSERLQRTGNTGARLAESRCINTSLHVLERCLHALRRARHQPAPVPYRESKLTRLLGTGLSGARGEAVSMVVTVNPHPRDEHETRHVLQLAAVARDIQVNSTIAESTMESLQDTTLATGAELMRLRADNERLHYELVQAQARNRSLTTSMEHAQQTSAHTMRELVAEAKDYTTQYYEAQMRALAERHRAEIEELTEELETKQRSASPGTPSRHSQALVTQLQTEVTILQEKLNAETLARERAEMEVQHLRACIEERDRDKHSEGNESDTNRDIMTLSDGEQEDEDVMNQSLEPSFRKEKNKPLTTQPQEPIDENEDSDEDITLNKTTRKSEEEMNQSLEPSFTTEKNKPLTKQPQHPIDGNADKDDNATLNETAIKSSVASKDSIDDNTINYTSCKGDGTSSNFGDESLGSSYVETNCDEKCASKDEVVDNKRDTYIVKDEDINDSKDSGCNVSKMNQKSKDSLLNESVTINVSFEGKKLCELPKSVVAKFKNSHVNRTMEDNKSLDQFEQFEKEIETREEGLQKQMSEDLIKVKAIEKKRYFDDVTVDITSDSQEVRTESSKNNSTEKQPYFDDDIKVDISSDSHKVNRESSKNSRTCKQTYFDDVDAVTNENAEFGNKKTYFDNNNSEKPRETPIDTVLSKSKSCFDNNEYAEIKTSKEKRTYFDNISANIDTSNIKTNEIDASIHSDDIRSPSIVKDEMPNDYEPTTIKKLLGDSRTSNVASTIKNKLITKVHDSLDIFDEIPSPRPDIANTVEDLEKCIKNISFAEDSKPEDNAVAKEDNTNLNSETEAFKLPENIATQKEVILSRSKQFQNPNNTNENKTKPNSEIKVFKLPENVATQKEVILSQSKQFQNPNNTETEFENIYKDVTASRTTEFDLLYSKELNNTDLLNFDSFNKTKNATGRSKQKTKHDSEDATRTAKDTDSILAFAKESLSKSGSNDEESKLKYNLRHKSHTEDKPGESTLKTKRSLRLKRRKNLELEDDNSESVAAKLKDIVNLQKEFSDVTLDVPVSDKIVHDIPSPEKNDDESENVAPSAGIQSCPAKSVTRSRRKLFTPRAEPLEESLNQTGDSADRPRVPRPSYHRGRARRKL